MLSQGRQSMQRTLRRSMLFYADDAVLMPTAEPVVRGKAAITEEWKHIFAIPTFHDVSKLGGVEVGDAGDLGYTYGSYRSQLMGEDDKLTMDPGNALLSGGSSRTAAG